MQCSSCGHQNRADARFCDRCAAPLAQGGQAAIVPQRSQFNTQNAGPGGVGWQSSTTINPSLPIPVPQGAVASSSPSAPPIQPGGHGGIVGIARNVQQMSEQSGYMSGGWGGRQGAYGYSVQVLKFRLEQYDQSGNRTRMMDVEMRGLSIPGRIIDGDWVEVFGRVEGGLIHAKRIANLTTGAIVKTRGIPIAIKVFMVIIAIVVVIGFAFVVYLIVFQGILNPAAYGPPPVSPDGVLSGYCTSLQAGDTQGAYNEYSTKLKSEVSSQQFSQMWSGYVSGCTYDSVQVSGNQATSTLHITTSSMPGPHGSEQTYTYHVILVQDGSNGWKIDSLQSQ